jgi:hypothetical protein
MLLCLPRHGRLLTLQTACFFPTMISRSGMTDVIRLFFCSQLLFCLWGLFAAEPLRAEQASGGGPVCLYQSKSYSEGAFVCVQKSLMLNCSTDGRHPSWKVVADRDLNERCVAPTALNHSAWPRRHARRTYAVRHRMDAAREISAKCFNFNGKQYCE